MFGKHVPLAMRLIVLHDKEKAGKLSAEEKLEIAAVRKELTGTIEEMAKSAPPLDLDKLRHR